MLQSIIYCDENFSLDKKIGDSKVLSNKTIEQHAGQLCSFFTYIEVREINTLVYGNSSGDEGMQLLNFKAICIIMTVGTVFKII